MRVVAVCAAVVLAIHCVTVMFGCGLINLPAVPGNINPEYLFTKTCGANILILTISKPLLRQKNPALKVKAGALPSLIC